MHGSWGIIFSPRTWISGARATRSHDTYMDFAVVPTCAFVDVKFYGLSAFRSGFSDAKMPTYLAVLQTACRP